MTGAMMLPSVAPTALAYTQVSRRPRAGTTFLLADYLVAWIGYGLLAYAVYRALRAAAPDFLRWDSGGRYFAGAAVAAAGVYRGWGQSTAPTASAAASASCSCCSCSA